MNHGLKLIIRTALVVMFLGAAARPAAADWLLTPYLGVVFGGAANTFDLEAFDDEFEQRFNFGGSLSWMGAGVFGFEVDYNLNPNFFQIKGETDDIELFELDSSITTLMGNLIIGVPIGGQSGIGVRPYFAGGVGLMRANIESPTDLFDDLSTNETGINVGGGLNIFFSDAIGLRGDLRYFRALEQSDDDEDLGLEDFDYWRATVGVTFRFGR